MPSVHRGALLALGIVSAGLILWRVRAWTEELGSLRETRVASAAAVETSPTRNKQPLAVATTPESAEVETGAPAPQSAKLDDVAPHIGLVDSKDSGAEDVHVEGSFEREQVVLTLKFVNSAEEPVEGVKVFNRHGPVARANAEGRVELHLDPSKGGVAIRAEHPSYVPLIKCWTLDELLLHPEQTIALYSGNTISGIVEDSSGLAQCSVTVTCRRSGPSTSACRVDSFWPIERESHTDGRGRFQIAAIPDCERVILTFSGSDRILAVHEVEMSVAKSCERWVLSPAIELGGIVLDDSGDPLAGADVAALAPALADVITGKSGEDGRFVLEGLFSGRWQVGARGIAWGRALEGTLQVDLPFASTDAPTEPLLLRLSDSARLPALPVRVHLFDAGTGHPLPEARGSILKDLVPRSGCSARVSEGGSFGELEFGQPEPKFELQDGWIADSFREGFYLVRFGYRDYEPSVASFEVAMIPLEIEIPMVPLYCD